MAIEKYEDLKKTYQERISSVITDTPLRSFDGQSLPMQIGNYFALGVPEGPHVLVHAKNKKSIEILQKLGQDKDGLTERKVRALYDDMKSYAATGMEPETLRENELLEALSDMRVVASRPAPDSQWYGMPDAADTDPEPYNNLSALILKDQEELTRTNINEGMLFYLGEEKNEESNTTHYEFSSPIGSYQIVHNGEDDTWKVFEYPVAHKLDDRFAMTDGSAPGLLRQLTSNATELKPPGDAESFNGFDDASAFLSKNFREKTVRNWHTSDPYQLGSFVHQRKQGLAAWWHDTKGPVRKAASVLKYGLMAAKIAISGGAEVINDVVLDKGVNFLDKVSKGEPTRLSEKFNSEAARKEPSEQLKQVFNNHARPQTHNDPKMKAFLRRLDFTVPSSLTIPSEDALTSLQKGVRWTKKQIGEFGSKTNQRGRNMLDPNLLLGKVQVLDLKENNVISDEMDYQDQVNEHGQKVDRVLTVRDLTDPLNPFMGGMMYPRNDGVTQVQHGGLVREFTPDENTIYVRFNPDWHDPALPALERERGYLHDGNVLKITKNGRGEDGLPDYDLEQIPDSQRRRELYDYTENRAWLTREQQENIATTKDVPEEQPKPETANDTPAKAPKTPRRKRARM